VAPELRADVQSKAGASLLLLSAWYEELGVVPGAQRSAETREVELSQS
jgi:hypothetical protein